MRTIKELLQIMLDNQQYFQTGLCGWSNSIKLSSTEEYDKLHSYIRNNKPSAFSSFERFTQELNLEPYWWKKGNIKPRINWIKKHIKKNS